MRDVDTRPASDLSQLSALSTLIKEGAMTPGALAVRERELPPSTLKRTADLMSSIVDENA